MELLERISEELQKGNFVDVPVMTREALAQGIAPERVLSDALVAGMDVVGEKFRRDELFMPEVLIAARAMQAAMAVLRPRLIETGVKLAGTIVIGTVKGDLHDIGKNLVGMLFEGAGYHVVDLGVDVAPEKFVAAVKAEHPEILGMSALLTTTMPRMKETVESLIEAGLRDQVRIMVGGAPVTERFAADIGADGYAPDAATAVERAAALIRH